MTFKPLPPRSVDDSSIALGGTVTWSPCGGDSESETRAYVIDAEGGSTLLETLPAGEPVGEASAEGFRVDLPSEDRQLFLRTSSEGSVAARELVVGEVRALGTGAVLGEVRIAVGR